MLTDRKIIGKLQQIEQRYTALRFEKIADVAMSFWETEEHFRRVPDPGPDAWRPMAPGTAWGADWMTGWFRGTAALPAHCAGRRVFVRARPGGETLFFADGEPHGVFDGNHPVVMLTGCGAAGAVHQIALETYAGHTIPGTGPNDKAHLHPAASRVFEGVEIVLEREDVSGFVFDLKVLNQLVKVLDENSLRRGRILAGLARVYACVDTLPDETGEQSWRPKLAEARALMRPLLDCANGPSTPWFGITGHSHIDTAWLWPLAETWRKCARTFSSALNLMEQYPEFRFIQSTPCHTEVVRSEYPGLYERIREAVAAGRWEPNGAMWVEPDCNIPSGEAFVRQLLIGQQTTREMFGYTADTLWLPDVFGYSAALPQILQGAGVRFFCTTKMNWNDTTRFPYDTFNWRGIDGTSVLAHFNTIHCWPDPEALTAQWNWVQHKDVQDRRYCSYGFGDGGGGPMAEMVEVARRVVDLEGCPRARHMSISDFMQSICDDMPGIPEWVGELYLELHRGTLTSVAGVKRGNRKSELALREAEFLCTLAALRGAPYPTGKLRETWKTLLTNQFHDILPGSSIARVNDEAIAALGECVRNARALAGEALNAVGAGTGSTALLLANSLSWERSGELLLEGVPRGMRPTGAGASAQWVEDVEGARRLAVGGVAVPPLGAVVLPLEPGEPAGASAFSVAGDRVETPHSVARFDEAGCIVSLLDKASGREVVSPGGALNALLVGEDVPQSYDNWDIDADQALKMAPERRLVSRTVVSDGPLQLRVRQEYRVGAGSTLVQDVVFHAGTARIDFETVVDWHETHKLLKAGFALNVHAESARHEIQYGHVGRPTHRNLPQDRARFEVCAHKWTDLSEAGFGVALLNDCKYGVGVHGSEVRLSLLKSGTHPDPRGDAGRHVMTYALLPHAGGFSVEAVVRPSYELNVPLTAAPAPAGTPGIESLVEVDAPNVIVESVKQAESGRGVVVRLYEAGRSGVACRVRVHPRFTSARETNLLEEEPRPLPLAQGAVTLSFRPFEIKTLVLE